MPKVRALIIENDPDMAEGLKERLELLGLEVDVAATPESGKKYLEERSYQMVVADYLLGPGQIRGDDFLLRNDKLIGPAKKLLITGQGRDLIRHHDEMMAKGARILEKGAKDFLDDLKQVAIEATGTVNLGTVNEAKYDAEGGHSSQTCLAGYASDDAKGIDLLNITSDVNALASVLAAKDIEPPLSLGLFGDWGSGKSFFMNQLQNRIQALQEDARLANGKSAYCENIVQLTFNAWNYIDRDLWASLAAEVFEGLAAAVAEKRAKDSKEERDLVLAAACRSEAVLAEVDREKRIAEEELEKSRERLAELERNEEAAATDLSPRELFRHAYKFAIAQEEIRRSIDNVAKELNIQEGAAKAGEIKGQILELEGMWSSLLFAIRNNRKAHVWILTLIVVLGSGWGIAQLLKAYGIEGLARYSCALLTGVSVFLTSFRVWTAKALHLIQDATRYRQSLVEQKQKERTAVLRSEYEAAQDRVQRARTAVANATRAVGELNNQLDRMRADRRLVDYIRQRHESSDYRQHLGVIARVRADFKQLSVLLREVHEDSNTQISGEQKAKQDAARALFPRVDRIVLYIDDLDRCSEEKVVQVLQAVHLLLAFPLFVVVVGVDARWLLHSLQQQAGLLEASSGRNKAYCPEEETLWEATPLNYLEKIFQIPFTLRPISEMGFGHMVDAFTGIGSIASDSAFSEDSGADSSVTMVQSPVVSDGQTATVEVTKTDGGVIERHPRHLEIGAEERVFMKALHEFVPSPRAAKRLINIYRLLRASRQDSNRPSIQISDTEAEYKSMLLLLAILIGYPAEANYLIQRLIEKHHAGTWEEFLGSFKGQITHPGDTVVTEGRAKEAANARVAESGLDWLAGSGLRTERWRELFDKLNRVPDIKQIPCSRFAGWAPQVARYSFRSGRILLYHRDLMN